MSAAPERSPNMLRAPLLSPRRCYSCIITIRFESKASLKSCHNPDKLDMALQRSQHGTVDFQSQSHSGAHFSDSHDTGSGMCVRVST
eukprot:11013-Eustigmatos_ZCMA.PRE.1